MRTSKDYLLKLTIYSKTVSHHHLYVAKVQRQAEWESFMVKKEKASSLF